jgi:putative transposase
LTVNVQEKNKPCQEGEVRLSGIAHHVIQRGHNRQVAFATDEDFQYYLGNLTSALRYGYCLMTNQVQVPPAVNSLALLLKHVASRQTRYANGLERRTGRLWQAV